MWREFCIKPEERKNRELERKRTVKYLGVFIDDRLKFLEHIDNVIDKARKAVFKYKNLFFFLKTGRKSESVMLHSIEKANPDLRIPGLVWYSPVLYGKVASF